MLHAEQAEWQSCCRQLGSTHPVPEPCCCCCCCLTESLTRILSTPRLAEVTGIYISYVGDYAYLVMGMQHPEEDTGPKVRAAEASMPSYWCHNLRWCQDPPVTLLCHNMQKPTVRAPV
jgi:hypothetical protein